MCNLVDASSEGQSAITIVGQLKKCIEFLPNNSINSIVSNSASSCSAARRTITNESDYKHVIQHRCLAHLLNRIGCYSPKTRMIADALEWATKVAHFVSGSTRIQARLRAEGINQFTRANPTRWYSTSNMIESLLKARDIIIDEASTLQDCALEALIAN